jgi:hypothetical protein
MVSKKISPWRILVGVVVGLVVLISGFFLIKLGITFVTSVLPIIGESATQTAISLPGWLNSVVTFLLGSSATQTIETLSISIIVFLILLFALGDIISQFTAFSDSTSWIIAIGLAVIAGVTNIVSAIVIWFGITAGVGALGIGVIIIGAIITAVVLNLVLQYSGIKKMLKDKESSKRVANAASVMKEGFGKLKGAADLDKE